MVMLGFRRFSSHGLNDSVLAAYLTELHDSGKSPATVLQVVAAVKWQAKNSSAGADDFTSQPPGNAGARIGCGTIIMSTEQENQVSRS